MVAWDLHPTGLFPSASPRTGSGSLLWLMASFPQNPSTPQDKLARLCSCLSLVIVVSYPPLFIGKGCLRIFQKDSSEPSHSNRSIKRKWRGRTSREIGSWSDPGIPTSPEPTTPILVLAFSAPSRDLRYCKCALSQRFHWVLSVLPKKRFIFSSNNASRPF